MFGLHEPRTELVKQTPCLLQFPVLDLPLRHTSDYKKLVPAVYRSISRRRMGDSAFVIGVRMQTE